MSDAFSALSIAASIIQIIEFGSKLVSKTHEIYRKGSTVGNEELRIVAKDIEGVNSELTRYLYGQSSTSTDLTKGEIVSATLQDSYKYKQLML